MADAFVGGNRLRDDRPDEGHCDCDFERGKEIRHRPGQPNLLDDLPARGVKGPQHVLQLGFRCRYPGRDVHQYGKERKQERRDDGRNGADAEPDHENANHRHLRNGIEPDQCRIKTPMVAIGVERTYCERIGLARSYTTLSSKFLNPWAPSARDKPQAYRYRCSGRTQLLCSHQSTARTLLARSCPLKYHFNWAARARRP